MFLSTFELLSYYNSILEKHIEEVKSKKNVISYFSPKIILFFEKSARNKGLNCVRE